jgi:Bacterial capsule synthesis protein PGA_cap
MALPHLTSLALGAAFVLAACQPTARDSGALACIPADGPTSTDRSVFQPGAVTVAAVGDVLMHVLLQEDAANSPRGYAGQFVHAAPYLRMADIAVANLEGPAARNVAPGGRDAPAPATIFDGEIYSGFPTFNYHPSLVTALATSGVDLLQTANNHALDRGPLGVDRTLQAIDAAGLTATGTRPRSDPTRPWQGVATAEGQRVAFLACSFSTNGIADPNRQVLGCYRDEPAVLAQIRALADDPAIAAVIFLPHWGAEYVETPESEQRRLGRAVLEAGAAAVIGTHPHVLQPIEPYRTSDGRDAFIAYSLGNFIASQWEIAQRSSVILFFDLVPDGAGGLTAEMPAWLPTRVMRYTSGLVVQPAEQAVDGQESLAHVARVLGDPGRLTLADIARMQGRSICTSG